MFKGRGCLGFGLAGLVVIGILLFVFYNKYNHLVRLDESVKAQWGNVNNAYQKRSDLVPNLVATVQGEADFEKGTLEAVIAQRANATKTVIDPTNLSQDAINQFQQAQSGLGGALSRLLVAVERYPDLKANQGFRTLQTELSSIEQEILHERKKYNDRAKEFNTYRNQIPNNFIASFVPKFAEKGYFQADQGAENAPDVEFDFNNENATSE